MKIVRWMSMMTMAAAMLLAGCSESINDGEGTDDGGLGNSGGNGSGNGGSSGLVIEDSLNKETSIVGVWQQEEQTNRYVCWIFRADGTCTRVLEYYGYYYTESEDSGIYQYENGKLVTSVIPAGSSALVYDVLLATENQLVLENTSANTNAVFTRITVDDEPADNVFGYWIADYYYKDYSSHNDIVIDRECEDYIVDLSQRSFKVKDKESGEVAREYYIGYISNKFMELFDKESNSSHLYYKNEEYNIDYGYPTATITETDCRMSKSTSPAGITSYSYYVDVDFEYAGFENVGRAVINIGSAASEEMLIYDRYSGEYNTLKYIGGKESYSSFYITIECYIKGCNYPIRLASATAYSHS